MSASLWRSRSICCPKTPCLVGPGLASDVIIVVLPRRSVMMQRSSPGAMSDSAG
jgi:hypothetical protein